VFQFRSLLWSNKFQLEARNWWLFSCFHSNKLSQIVHEEFAMCSRKWSNFIDLRTHRSPSTDEIFTETSQRPSQAFAQKLTWLPLEIERPSIQRMRWRRVMQFDGLQTQYFRHIFGARLFGRKLRLAGSNRPNRSVLSWPAHSQGASPNDLQTCWRYSRPYGARFFGRFTAATKTANGPSAPETRRTRA